MVFCAKHLTRAIGPWLDRVRHVEAKSSDDVVFKT